MNYQAWAQRHPQAAAELQQILHADAHHSPEGTPIKSEAYAQQAARLQIAKQGGLAWRNNVGATPAVTYHNCPKCHFHFEEKQQPVRFGVCNDSAKLNSKIKSADLLGIIPRLITPALVGSTIGQFASWEAKKPGWVFNPNDPHEVAQLAWGSLTAGKGAHFEFTTGAVQL